MPGIGGLSVANNVLANSVQLNLDQNQSALQRSVSRLSSGLRINTAADDPSGLAVAEKLQAQVNGFDQAARNVQDASNAATVAEGALQTTTDILQRIRTLVVEAASDITSSSDRANLQTEIGQLLLEVNRVAEDTTFNGIALLDGSHAGVVPATPATVTVYNAAIEGFGLPVIQDADFSSPPIANNSATFLPNGTPWTFTSVDGSSGVYRGANPPGFSPPVPPPTNQAAWLNVDGDQMSQAVGGFQSGAQYQLTFQAGEDVGAGANGLTVLLDGNVIFQGSPPPNQQWQTFTTAPFTASGGNHTLTFEDTSGGGFSMYLQDIVLQQVSPPPSSTTNAQLIATAVAANANFQTTFGGTQGLGGTGTTDGSIQVQVVNTGASVAAVATYFDSATGTTAIAPTLYPPGGTVTDFDNVAITLGNFTAQDVGLSAYAKVGQAVAAVNDPSAPALQVQSGAAEGSTVQIGLPAADAATLRVSNVNVALSSVENQSLAAQDALGQLDIALGLVLTERAQLGAIAVRLGEDQDNDNVASVNLQASESAIRDLDVAGETTTFNRLQILVQVGTSVLAQSNTNAQSVLRLFP